MQPDSGSARAGVRGCPTCPRCAISSRSTPLSRRPTSTSCTGSPATGSSCPICPSPTCCCGFRWPTAASSAWRRCGPPPRPPPTTTTRSAGPRSGPKAAHLATAIAEQRIWREGDPVWHANVPARHEAIPVRRGGEVIGVVGRDTNLAATRVPEPAGAQLPPDRRRPVPDGRRRHVPARRRTRGRRRRRRASATGSLRLDAAGRVTYASPNAQSAYRRLGLTGDLLGEDLPQLTGRADHPIRWRAGRRPSGSPRPSPARPRRAARSRRAARPCSSGRCRCCRRGSRSARWCWSGTSPMSAAATAS